MTKEEEILKRQIKELERLIEIKDAIIAELRELTRRYSSLRSSSGIKILYR